MMPFEPQVDRDHVVEGVTIVEPYARASRHEVERVFLFIMPHTVRENVPSVTGFQRK